MLATVALTILASAGSAQEAPAPEPRAATEQTYDHIKPSVFTIEVRSGAEGAKDRLGSGYVISDDGLLVTNYHVVAAYIDDPDRYSVWVQNGSGKHQARLLQFDLSNDLALIQVAGLRTRPLPLRREPLAPGAPIVAFGNPHGLGLSLIEGVFNGFAEKGFVDRMLLSMPLNSGMSGGPILSARGEVVGTNVSVMRHSNSLSFGVPVAKLTPLRAAPSLQTTREALLRETNRQLMALEAEAFERAVRPNPAATVSVGSAEFESPPELFECWNNVNVFKEEGIVKSSHACNLQFTPSEEEIGEVGSVELLFEHFSSRGGRWGFYNALSTHAGTHHEVEARDPQNGVLSAPQCVGARVNAGPLVWDVHTCMNAYVKHAGLFNFDLVATSLSSPRQAAYLALHMKGFRYQSFSTVVGKLLRSARLPEGR